MAAWLNVRMRSRPKPTTSQMKQIPRVLFCGIILTCAQTLFADVVRTKDGSNLRGRIESINDGVLHLQTAYAGNLQVKLAEVLGFSTDEESFLRLENNSESKGRVQDRVGQPLLIAGDAPLEVPISEVRQLWRTVDADPVAIAQQAAEEALRKKWTSSISFDLTGSSGNADNFGLASQFKAAYGNKTENTKFQLSYHKSHKSGETTADEAKAGVEHTSFFGEKTGWYVKTDLETDKLEEVDLRSTTAAGIKYALLELDDQKLDARAGLAFRFESYETADESAPAVDIGLEHAYRLTELISFVTELDYVPSVEEFGDYRFTQDTGIEIPIAKAGRWKLRTGLANDYNSRPTGGNERLDVRYYTRLVFSWE